MFILDISIPNNETLGISMNALILLYVNIDKFVAQAAEICSSSIQLDASWTESNPLDDRVNSTLRPPCLEDSTVPSSLMLSCRCAVENDQSSDHTKFRSLELNMKPHRLKSAVASQ